ncbi:MAG: DUF5107 domain-containing protein [Opitutaceae bacterium]|nr:DUF5107 domain-containing protein [Opitutaceae bacterium]
MPTDSSQVQVRREKVTLPTYLPEPPSRHPMFFERRVYQGSSGRVYPMAYYERIAERPVPREWDVVYIGNEFLEVMILPELGGRVHAVRDRTNGYDAVYAQPVIKPALVGLAGPWVSGGIEFNWPQHHRPATYLPVEVAIEHDTSGVATVWLSDHDPMARMKGMHGVRLRPGSSVLELAVRVYNRTDDTQTFLWWANVAVQVHERYETFFPPDVTHVADHARRAMSTFPLCTGRYYGVDYARRQLEGVPAAERPQLYPPRPDGAANNLAWYANIPVPTSYMCIGSRSDFFGGYDHRAQAGLVHVASHHISPGKKQWTWGNHEFGYAWDRNLTDARADGEYPPYIELMAGVYTDNQPDFSFLAPGETKTWTQSWYPIQRIGPAHAANTDAALNLAIRDGRLRIGVAVTRVRPALIVRVSRGSTTIAEWRQDAAPNRPLVAETTLAAGVAAADLTAVVLDASGGELLCHAPRPPRRPESPVPASEPPEPEAVSSADELYLIGLHLEQYRHPTRMPELYWREALRRDPGDARCCLAMGRWHLRRGEFARAEEYLRASVRRYTSRNANPPDGEPFYQLGRCLRLLGRDDEAYDAFYKSTWNQAWAAAAFHALGEIDGTRGDWTAATEHLRRALRLNADNLRARALLAVARRRLGNAAAAEAELQINAALDPLDPWTRWLLGQPIALDVQTRLDVAHDCARAGQFGDALALLAIEPEAGTGTAPLHAYTRAWLHERDGDAAAAAEARAIARAASPDYCFPARLEEICVLEAALLAEPGDARARYYLGNLLYDRRRHAEAIELWERAASLDPAFAIVHRNLGIGYYNILRDPKRARDAYDRAIAAAPADARLLYERDQLWKRTRESPQTRIAVLDARRESVLSRDDLALEYCALLNLVGRHEEARELLRARRFQPWEGGEGLALGQHARTHLALGRRALGAGLAKEAGEFLTTALGTPENLGEARHLLANRSDLLLALGDACAAAGHTAAAREKWTGAARHAGDFQEMSVRAYSEMTYFGAMARRRLGDEAGARGLLEGLRDHARQLHATTAKVDYFATSLPALLLLEEDLQERQTITALFLEAQAAFGLGEIEVARTLLDGVLSRDPSHALAHELVASLPLSNR